MDRDNRQGFILSNFQNDSNRDSVFLLFPGTPVWPIRIIDKAGTVMKPFPIYKGYARLEGQETASLVKTFCDDQGFQPCLLHISGVQMKIDDKMRIFLPSGGLYLAAVVRYCTIGKPELRVLTREATPELTQKSGWKRQPIHFPFKQGDPQHPSKVYQTVKDLVESTRREGENRFAPAKPTLSFSDPFAA